MKNMEELRQEKEKTYRLVLFIGELLLKNGGETFRVERLCSEICVSKGFKHLNLFITPTCIMIGDDRADGITFIKQIKERTINLEKVSQTNQVAIDVIKNTEIPFVEIIKKLKLIEQVEIYSPFVKLIGAGIGSVSFVLVFNSTFLEAFLVVLVSMISLWLYKKVIEMVSIPIFGTVIATFLISTAGFFLTKYNIIENSNLVIIGSILPFLPGMAITKSISDLVSGDFISGSARATEAFLTALSIGIGVGIGMKIWLKIGGVF